MITVIDYGLGNINAFTDIYKNLNIPCGVARSAADLHAATRLILPGVGSFDWAMSRLNASGMRDTLDDLVMARKVPVLGVCVGMQMMAGRSDEGELPGLGWIPGEVKRFDEAFVTHKSPLPHMGWNEVHPVSTGCLFRHIESACFYFLHSYYVSPEDPGSVLGTTDYNGTFASSIRAGNVFGTQFHPEKSHRSGVLLLRNFAEA